MVAQHVGLAQTAHSRIRSSTVGLPSVSPVQTIGWLRIDGDVLDVPIDDAGLHAGDLASNAPIGAERHELFDPAVISGPAIRIVAVNRPFVVK